MFAVQCFDTDFLRLRLCRGRLTNWLMLGQQLGGPTNRQLVSLILSAQARRRRTLISRFRIRGFNFSINDAGATVGFVLEVVSRLRRISRTMKAAGLMSSTFYDKAKSAEVLRTTRSGTGYGRGIGPESSRNDSKFADTAWSTHPLSVFLTAGTANRLMTFRWHDWSDWLREGGQRSEHSS